MSDKSDLVILQKTNRGRDKENPTRKHEMTKKMMNKDSRYPLISIRNGYKVKERTVAGDNRQVSSRLQNTTTRNKQGKRQKRRR